MLVNHFSQTDSIIFHKMKCIEFSRLVYDIYSKATPLFNTWKGVDTKEMFKIGVFSTTLGLCV